MRALLLAIFLLSGPTVAGRLEAAVRPSLDFPVRYPDRATALPHGVPAYQGDILEVRLVPHAAVTARVATAANMRRAQLGLSGLDGLARDLGGTWFEPEFPGEVPPVPGSAEPDFTSFYIAHLPPGLELEDALARFRSLADVASADPIAVLPVTAVPNDSLFQAMPGWAGSTWFYQPSRQDIHGPEAWDVTTGDTSIVVAVLDTGVLPYHPDLGGTVAGLPGQIWTNWAEQGGVAGVDDDGNGFVDDVHGWDFVSLNASTEARPGEDWQDADNDPNDFATHGTGVAGVVGALANNTIGVTGTAWSVRIMPLRMGWSWRDPSTFQVAPQGSGEVRMDFAAQAILYAARMGAHVINCSWANLNQSGLDAAITAATQAGVVVVVAAGNSGGVSYMTNRPDVISVAATTSMDFVPAFSNIGPNVDLAAPGVGIATTWLKPWDLNADSVGLRQPDYHPGISGTSLSAPMVAGTIALMQARQVELGRELLSPAGVLLRLHETTDDISAQNPSKVGLYGSGRLNAYRSVGETWRSSATRTGGQSSGAAVVLPGSGAASRVAFAASNSSLVILDGTTQDTVMVTTLPAVPTSGLAASDLGGGRGIGLFVGLSGSVAGLDPSGAPLPGWPRTDPDAALVGQPALGDLDADGQVEVVAGADDGQVWAWRADGTPAAGFPVAVGSAGFRVTVALSDLDGVPGAEIVAAAGDGTVAALRGNGTMLSGWPVIVATGPTAPTVFGLGGSRSPTIVVAASDRLHALSSAGVERLGFPVTLQAVVIPNHDVALGDVDLDGDDDLVVATAVGVEVRDGSGASLTALNWPRLASSVGVGSPVLGHLTGGGAPELLMLRGSGLVGYSNAADSLAAFPKPGAVGAFLTLADLDRDNTTEVVAGSGADGVFYIYDAGPASADTSAQPWLTYRGNFARTGSRLYSGGAVPPAPPATGLALRIRGNPSRLPASLYWRAASGTLGARQAIRIYDLMGRQRATIDLGAGAEGVAVWDGRDASGHAVRAGLYLARFSSGPAHVDARFVVMP